MFRRCITAYLLLFNLLACQPNTNNYSQNITLYIQDRETLMPVENATATFIDETGRTIAISEGKNSRCFDGRHCLTWQTSRDSRFYTSSQQDVYPDYVRNSPIDATKVSVTAPGCLTKEVPLRLDKKYIESSGFFCLHGCHGPSWMYTMSDTVFLECPMDTATREIAAQVHFFYGTKKPCPQQLLAGIRLAGIPSEDIQKFRPDFTNASFAKDFHTVIDWQISACRSTLSAETLRRASEILRNLEGEQQAALPLFHIIQYQFSDKSLHAAAIEMLKSWDDKRLPTFLETELNSCSDMHTCDYLLRARVKLLAHPDQSPENQQRVLESFAQHPNEQIRLSVESLKHPPPRVSWF